jgi:hypothetical protein
MPTNIKSFEDFKLLESCGGNISGCGGSYEPIESCGSGNISGCGGSSNDYASFYDLPKSKKARQAAINKEILEIVDKDLNCKCGQPLKGTEKFCPECGEKIKAKKKKKK